MPPFTDAATGVRPSLPWSKAVAKSLDVARRCEGDVFSRRDARADSRQPHNGRRAARGVRRAARGVRRAARGARVLDAPPTAGLSPPSLGKEVWMRQ